MAVLTFACGNTKALVLEEDPECAHDAKNFRCVKYLGNHDGDTITVAIPRVHPLLGKKISVRVAGVDTPEMTSKNPCEKKKAELAKMLTGELLRKSFRINLENVGRDKYFRIVADVKFDGKSLGSWLLRAKGGIARPYDGKTKSKAGWCPKRRPPSRR